MLLHGRVAVNSLPRTLAQLRREIVTAGLVIAAIMVGALSPMGLLFAVLTNGTAQEQIGADKVAPSPWTTVGEGKPWGGCTCTDHVCGTCVGYARVQSIAESAGFIHRLRFFLIAFVNTTSMPKPTSMFCRSIV